MWNVTHTMGEKGSDWEGGRVFPREGDGVKRAVSAPGQSWPKCIQGRPSKTEVQEIECPAT